MKNVASLMNALSGMSASPVKTASDKQASELENLPDPNEKGPVTPGEGGTDELKPPMASETGAKDGDDALGNTPTDPKLESNGGEANPVKCATGGDFAEKANALRSKMAAAFGAVEQPSKEAGEAAPPADPAPAAESTPAKEAGADPAPAATPAPAKEAGAEEVPAASGDDAPQPAKTASFREQLVDILLKSASGRQLLNQAADEIIGEVGAHEIVMKAAAEQEQDELAVLHQKMAAAEQAQAILQQREFLQGLDSEFQDLTKDASAEDLEKIDKQAAFIRHEAEPFSENAAAANFFSIGVKCAAAMMAAQDEGAADPMAAAAPMPEGGMPSMDEIIAALEELVTEGKITPEMAEQVLAVLAQDPAMGGGAPKAASADDEVVKRSSVLDSILDNVKKINAPAPEAAAG